MTDTHQHSPAPAAAPGGPAAGPGAHQAFVLLRTVFTVAPILFGLTNYAVRPQIGGYVVALWLAGITVNLVSIGDYYDIALRDFGLLVAAVALARLASMYSTTPLRASR